MKFAMGAGAMPAGFSPKAPVEMPLMRVGVCVGTLTLTPDGEAVVEITDPALQAEVMGDQVAERGLPHVRGGPVITHGTRGAYTNGRCRCEPCRAANRKYMRRYTKRYRRIPARVLRSMHGRTGTYTNYGCRCRRCRAAWAEKQRAYRQRQKGEAA